VTRVLLDQGLAPAAAAILRAGWDAVHVSEIDCKDVTIRQSWNMHGSHPANTAASMPSVIFLRPERMKAVRQAELIVNIRAEFGEVIGTGAAISCDGKSIRVRRLPFR
jgi:hypothetical protein